MLSWPSRMCLFHLLRFSGGPSVAFPADRIATRQTHGLGHQLEERLLPDWAAERRPLSMGKLVWRARWSEVELQPIIAPPVLAYDTGSNVCNLPLQARGASSTPRRETVTVVHSSQATDDGALPPPGRRRRQAPWHSPHGAVRPSPSSPRLLKSPNMRRPRPFGHPPSRQPPLARFVFRIHATCGQCLAVAPAVGLGRGSLPVSAFSILSPPPASQGRFDDGRIPIQLYPQLGASRLRAPADKSSSECLEYGPATTRSFRDPSKGGAVAGWPRPRRCRGSNHSAVSEVASQCTNIGHSRAQQVGSSHLILILHLLNSLLSFPFPCESLATHIRSEAPRSSIVKVTRSSHCCLFHSRP